MRWALGIEYDGSAYHGWQTQADSSLKTLQSVVEAALSKVANHPVQVICAGRTDRGVHALEQVIHFDSESDREARMWLSGFNHFLAPDIRGTWIKPVTAEFHARYSALARSYCYVIYNHAIRPALWRQKVTWFPQPLCENSMSKAAQFLLGEHDFSAFRAVGCQSKTPIRRVDSISIVRKDSYIFLHIQANAFLHHMVRNIVGVLKEIGSGKKSCLWAKEVLLGKDRSLGGITAPPHGLYLTRVFYPEKWNFPHQNSGFMISLQ